MPLPFEVMSNVRRFGWMSRLPGLALVLPLVTGVVASCAQGETLDEETDQTFTHSDASFSSGGAGAAPTGGGGPTGAVGPTGGTGNVTGTGAAPSGGTGAGGSGGAAVDAGPPPPTCADGLKTCGGLCVGPSPSLGCALDNCDPCPEVTNGTVACNGDACEITCDQGYNLTGDECIGEASCQNTTQDGNETDVDCGGDLCPPCATGEACLVDGDCESGPCVDDVCTCVASTCEDLASCATSIDDGCGQALDCTGTCTGDDICFNDACCTPALSCPAGGCGAALGDGCGGTLDCTGNCGMGEVCNNGSCCMPATCGPDDCGMKNDGCGGTLDCGDPCGGGDVCYQNACCTPSTCSMSDCGFQSDGCGGSACALCPNGEVCSNDNDCENGNCAAQFPGFGCGFLNTQNCCE